MTTVAIRELKNRLSEYLRKVKAGERVVITERGRGGRGDFSGGDSGRRGN
jgi:hypothetical protein